MNTKRNTVSDANSFTFKKEMQWFDKLFRLKASEYRREVFMAAGETSVDFAERDEFNEILNYPLPDENESVYASFLNFYKLKASERAAIILALLPVVAPGTLEKYVQPGYFFPSPPREFGFRKMESGTVLPTGETILFIIGGGDISIRSQLLQLFEKDHFFKVHNLLSIKEITGGESFLSGTLIPGDDLLDLFFRGEQRKPDLTVDFPAKLLKSEMDWEDIILPSATLNQLNEIELWLNHNEALMKDKKISKKIKPGYRALFYGPPGTGKTLSACLIGKKTGRDVYRVDLSTIVSKYIGETEKNLAKLFDKAEKKDWILFFDEADSLFGKRTNVNDSNDRYANQEVSYLLQRIEYHDGLVILATNMKNNMDGAFLRRFQTIAYFPLPKPEERLQLWQNAFSDTIPADKNIAFADIAKKYELSGSLILNIVSHTTLRALNENSPVVTNTMLLEGISRELAKEGRTV